MDKKTDELLDRAINRTPDTRTDEQWAKDIAEDLTYADYDTEDLRSAVGQALASMPLDSAMKSAAERGLAKMDRDGLLSVYGNLSSLASKLDSLKESNKKLRELIRKRKLDRENGDG